MNGAFTDQILAEKLAKLNSSQQSIETLSHWCIFHRKRAAQVVQRWEKDFKAAQPSRKVPFLYLANDILQNSRRKGAEFVNEFWKALPGALQDLTEHGDDSARATVTRLVTIWEDRKVFGAKEKSLRDLLLAGVALPASPGLPRNNGSKSKEKSGGAGGGGGGGGGGASPGSSSQEKGGLQTIQSQLNGPLEKIAAAHAAVQDLASEEESALRKCSAAVNDLQELEKQSAVRIAAGPSGVAAVAEELQSKQGVLAKWTNQLETCEKKRTTLVNLLREALRTQESKLERIRSQVQVAQTQAEHAISIRHKLLTSDGKPTASPTPPPAQNGSVSTAVAGEQKGGAAGSLPPPSSIESSIQDPQWSTLLTDQTLTSEPSNEAAQRMLTMEESQVSQAQFTNTPSPIDVPSLLTNGFPTEASEQERYPSAAAPMASPSEEEAKKKQEAAELAAKLAASSSSAAMLSSALSSLAAEGGLPPGLGLGTMRHVGGVGGEGDFRLEKRPRIDSPGEAPRGPPSLPHMGGQEGNMYTSMYMTTSAPPMMNPSLPSPPFTNFRPSGTPPRMGGLPPPPPLPQQPLPMQSLPPPPGFAPSSYNAYFAQSVGPQLMAQHSASMPSPSMPRPPASV